MKQSQHSRRAWLYCMLAGFTLANVALFLHPMSPQDFLWLAWFDPLATLFDSQGTNIAALFWASAVLLLSGMLGWVVYSRTLQRLLAAHKMPHFKALAN